MKITLTSKQILNQLRQLCMQLNASEYSKSLPLLMDNSLGKHIRHVIEFYQCLMYGISNNVVNYDSRRHNRELEVKPNCALAALSEIDKWFNAMTEYTGIQLKLSYNTMSGHSLTIQTNIERELVYNIEHAIHHMAIIRIALEKEFSHIDIPESFGVAYSTQKYRDDSCAH